MFPQRNGVQFIAYSCLVFHLQSLLLCSLSSQCKQHFDTLFRVLLWPLVINSFTVTMFGEKWSQCISVGATGCRYEDRGTHFLARAKESFLRQIVATGLGPKQPVFQ